MVLKKEKDLENTVADSENKDCFKKLARLINNIADVDDKHVHAGWMGKRSHPHRKGVSVAQIAYWQEFGIHKRPFLEPMIRDQKEQWKIGIQAFVGRSFSGRMKASSYLSNTGEMVVNSIKKSIEANDVPLTRLSLALRHQRTDLGRVPLGLGFIGRVLGAIKKGETGNGELGEPSKNTKPLMDTLTMYNSVKFKRGDGSGETT